MTTPTTEMIPLSPEMQTLVDLANEQERQAHEEREAALFMQGEQAYAYWATTMSSPIGRANSRERLAAATMVGADPLVFVVHWLNGLTLRARRRADRASR